MMTTEERNKLREALAAYAHDAWSGWMKYLFAKCQTANGFCPPADPYMTHGMTVIPKPLVERWKRQLKTLYTDLPEEEKESDRSEADKILTLLEGRGIYLIDSLRDYD